MKIFCSAQAQDAERSRVRFALSAYDSDCRDPACRNTNLEYRGVGIVIYFVFIYICKLIDEKKSSYEKLLRETETLKEALGRTVPGVSVAVSDMEYIY